MAKIQFGAKPGIFKHINRQKEEKNKTKKNKTIFFKKKQTKQTPSGWPTFDRATVGFSPRAEFVTAKWVGQGFENHMKLGF